jgi:SH3-like domain-containing protein
LGRSEEQEPSYEVAVQKLNIRNGPGVEYETVSEPLAESTRIDLLESLDRWSKVEVEAENDLEGWVFSKYIRPL